MSRLRSLLTAALAAVVVAVAAPAVASAVTITGYPTLDPAAIPREITAGTDGALWFTQNGTTAIGRITTAGVRTDLPTPNPDGVHVGITTGPGDAVWFTDQDPGPIPPLEPPRLGRLGTGGDATSVPVGGFDALADVVTTSDGALWFTDGAGRIGRLTPSGEVASFRVESAPGENPSCPDQIAVGPDAAVWFTSCARDVVTRLPTDADPASGADQTTSFPIPAGSRAYGIVAGPDGALWYAASNRGAIGRITTAGVVTEFPLPTPGSNPRQITTGPDGALWFTTQGTPTVGRITTAGAVTQYDVGGVGLAPDGIVKGPDGALWFALNSGAIGRLVPDPVSADADGDGIDDAVDLDAGAGTRSDGFFDDTGDGKITDGRFVDRRGLTITVEDLLDPRGVRLSASGGTSDSPPALVSACAERFELEIAPGSSLGLKCGSVTVSDVTGSPVTVRLPDGLTSVTVPVAASARVDVTDGDGFVVDEVTGAPVTVTVDGTSDVVAPGEVREGRGWRFVGFAPPVDNGEVLNRVAAGRTVPLKWRLLDASGTPVTTLTQATLRTRSRSCPTSVPVDDIEELAAAGSGLVHEGDGFYHYNWTTPRSFAGACKTLQLDIGDGVTHDAAFVFRR